LLRTEVNTLIELLFWFCAGLFVYVYFGYAVLLTMLARATRKRSEPTDLLSPQLTLLISAFNESAVIASKLKNALALDYPREQLEILVISDASDDGTDEIVQRYSKQGVQLIRQQPRMGKSTGLNMGVSHSSGQILVFSDANALYQPDALRQLVKHFSDPGVGYVVGNARYYEKGSESSSAESEGLYWKIETYLKRAESRFGSVVGGDGAIYAIRRELYSPLSPTDINDFLNPLQIIARGYTGIFEPAAVCYEEAAESFRQEFRRKVRIISRSLNALRRVPSVLNPFGNFRHWFSLISHKVLRWFAPFFMILLLAASFMLSRIPIYRAFALIQTVFYAMALIGWFWHPNNKIGKVFSLAYYFCLVNLASFVGCLKCFRGDLSGQWTPPRQTVQKHT
jgi:cellulose synthase/poly-beta-1,6-N-acetylglucosamine synthase-like glycosyltransferase